MPVQHRRRPARSAASMLAALAFATTILAPAATAAEPARSIDGEILIRYAPATTAQDRAEIARAGGLTPVRTSVNGRTEVVTAGGRATATVRRTLADDPRVVAVAANQQRELAVDPKDEPKFGDLWALDNVGQTLSGTTLETGVSNVDIDGLQALRSGLGDQDVVVAVIDDGVDFLHPDLATQAWTNPGEAGSKASNGVDDDGNGYVDDVHGWDFCNGDRTLHDKGMDGHGTHVAGTVAAALNGQGVIGVAPGIRIMALKFIDDGWTCGSDDLAIEAIDYAASFGVPIINASWGGPQPSAVLDAAIAQSNALFVAAAGNGGLNLDAAGGPRFYPASSTVANVLAVTAVDQAGRRPAFANYGATSVDLAAPGTNILSAYPADLDCPTPCYAWSAGTSMAAPHVSGVAALAGSHQASILADPIALRSRLLSTGRAIESMAGKTTTGRLVNAMRAIDTGKPVVRAADRYGFGVGTVIGARSITTYVRWPAASDAVTGVASYQVRRRGPEGWTTAGSAVTGTSVKSSLRYGGQYQFRVRATDRAGNVGGPADGPVVTPTLHGDATALATYGPGWSRTSSNGATGATLRTSYTGGSWMTFSFNGRSVGLVAPRGATRGDVKVYVDGVYASTVSLYRPSAQSQVIVFSRSWSTKGPHTIRLVVAGTAGHSRVDVDGFVVIR